MAVSKKWLAEVRARNRARMGMAGLGGLGSTQLQAAFNRPPPQDDTDRIGTPLPPVEIPRAPQIPRKYIYFGGAVFLALLGMTVYTVVRRQS